MSPARIPDGSVFVARRSGENVALQLLEAAEQIGADRDLSVRTTSGGYHVYEEVAEQYQANLPESDEDEVEVTETTDEGDPDESKTVEDEEAEAEAKRLAEEAAAGKTETPEIGVTDANTRAEIDEYAAKLTPSVDTTKAANKPDAIKLIEDALKSQTPAE